MNDDPAFDDLYDLRDLRETDAWFHAAGRGVLDQDDPLGAGLRALLHGLDHEVELLAPLPESVEIALFDALNGRPVPTSHHMPESRPEARARGGRHVRRSVLVAGVTATLVAGVAGVAVASPGSWLYPVRQTVLGQSASATPDELDAASQVLDRVESDITAAQDAGGILDATRDTLATRLGEIHAVIEAGSGDAADTLRDRWTRDDLVLIALPRLADAQPPVSGTPAAVGPPSTAPTPAASQDGGHPAPSTPTHPPRPSTGGHAGAAGNHPKPSPTTRPVPTKKPDPTQKPDPKPTQPSDGTTHHDGTSAGNGSTTGPSPTPSATPSPTRTHGSGPSAPGGSGPGSDR